MAVKDTTVRVTMLTLAGVFLAAAVVVAVKKRKS